MNQPTREEFEAFKAEIRKQITEEIKTVRVEVASADVIKRLDDLEQKIDTVQEDTNRVTIQMEGTRADILRVSESQADLRDKLVEHGQHLEIIREQQERNTATLGGLMDFAESHDRRFDRIEANQNDQKEMLQKILDKLG